MAPEHSAELVRLTREDLYEQVWAEPMRTLAKRLGISDVGLAKNCRKLEIPLPGRGYWAKKAAGHKVRKLPLPKLPPNSALAAQVVAFGGPQPEPVEAAPPETGPVAEQRAFEQRAENRIVVAEALRSPHPLVRKSLDALKGSAKKDDEYVGNWREYPLDMQVSKALLPRAARIMDAAIKAMERRGCSVTVNRADRDRKTYVTVLGQRVAFGIREPIKKLLNEPAKPVRSTSDGTWYTPHQSKYRDEPSGKLSMVLRSHWEGSTAVERSWIETATQPLEDQLNAFMVGVVEFAQYWNEWDLRRAENERQRHEAEQRRIEQQRRQQVEALRQEALRRQAARWTESQQIIEYLAAVRAKADAQPGGLIPDSPIANWLEWAEGYSHSLNPLDATLESLLHVPPPKLSTRACHSR